MGFTGHFHVHTQFSPLDGSGNSNQLTHQAVCNGNTHLGLTDHGRLGGALDHIDCCRNPEKYDNPLDETKKRGKDERLIPILGVEAFWRPDRFMDLTDKDKYGKNGHNWAQHLALHAGSLNGWHTLMRLSSKSWVRREEGGGFYGKAVMDLDMLRNDNEDIIVSTACMSSPLSHLILDGDEEGAKKWCKQIMRIVGQDNLFFEIMPHDLEQQRILNVEIINLANYFGRPYMVTGDVHTPYADWKDTHSIVRMMTYKQTISQQEQKQDAGEDTYTEEIDTCFLSSEEELQEMFAQYHPDLPASVVQQGLDNTEEFARSFKGYVIGKTTKLPRVSKTPEEGHKKLASWCEQGLKRIGKEDDKIYRDRYEYEFDVLVNKNVVDYFILIGDMVRWAKSDKPLPRRDSRGRIYFPADESKRPIRVGLGRGSAAGCLVSYLVGITAIDPISWKLLFERFLNPDRVGLPDIDLDFETELNDYEDHDGNQLDGREMVKAYLKVKYGNDHVADIIAYQTFAPRAVIRDVALTQDINYLETRKVTDTIGDTERDIQKIMAHNEDVAAFMEKYPTVLKHCLRLEDQIMRDSRHAGGVVITEKPITNYMPTQLGNDDRTIVTAWADRANFQVVSEYGFVKIDVLGVKSLSKQELCCQLIERFYDEQIEPNDLEALKDPYATEQPVIDAFVSGLTAMVFQFGGRGITQLLRHIRPDNAIDIAVANALYRPGPIKQAFIYGDRKNSGESDKNWYWHEACEPVLKETLGIVAFQEQVMQITKDVGNFTGGQADSMRKAISKLYRLPGDEARKFMQQYRDQWQQGCLDNGLKDKDAEAIWAAILEFAGYGFNRSHSASYALQAYQDMWLKMHYPLCFYASGLTVEKKAKKVEQIDHLKTVFREARIFDIDISPPDVNDSEHGWSLRKNDRKLMFGLSSISDLGGKGAADVIENKPYRSFKHFIKKTGTGFPVSKTMALTKAGAFDSLADRRKLLSKTRKWDSMTAKFSIIMTCGCKKVKTVKVTEKQVHESKLANPDFTKQEMLDERIDIAMEGVECKKHPEAEIDTYEETDSMFHVAQWIKENIDRFDNFKSVPPYVLPTDEEISAYEAEALNIPLSVQHTILKYTPFIEERIYTEEEFDELPPKPKKTKDKHGTMCPCPQCEAAHCIIGGEIISIKVIETKKAKKKMAFIDVAFGSDQWSVTLFPWVYEKYASLLTRPTAFLLAGHRDERKQFIAYEVRDVLEVAEHAGWEPEEDKPVVKRKIKTRVKVAA